MQLYWNFKLYCFYFFQNLRFQIRGAAYLRMRLIHGHLRYTKFYYFLKLSVYLYGSFKYHRNEFCENVGNIWNYLLLQNMTTIICSIVSRPC